MKALQFAPLVDFFSEAFDSRYCVGLRYTIRKDNPRLAVAVARWLEEGKVELVSGGSVIPFAKLGGTGKVE